MKMVIELSEDLYQSIQECNFRGYEIFCAIRNGTPLPKGHGRLIDADDIDSHIVGSVDTRDCPTIIEADKEGEQE